MATLFQESFERVCNHKAQDKFYKQVRKVIYIEDQYIKIKNEDNIFEFYRGEKASIYTRPLEFALKIDAGEKTDDKENGGMIWEDIEGTIREIDIDMEELISKRDKE